MIVSKIIFIHCFILLIIFTVSAMDNHKKPIFPEEVRYQQAINILENNVFMPKSFYGHKKPNPLNSQEGRFEHHIPSAAALANIAFKKNDYQKSYTLSKIVLDSELENFKTYKNDMAKLIKLLFLRGNKPAALVYADHLFENAIHYFVESKKPKIKPEESQELLRKSENKLERAFNCIASVQKYIIDYNLPDIDYELYQKLLRKVELNYDNPIAHYILGVAHESGIMSHLSLDTAYVHYTFGFELSRKHNNPLYEIQSFEKLKKLAMIKNNFAFCLIEILATIKNYEMHACDLFQKVIPSKGKIEIPTSAAQSIAGLNDLNHPAQYMARSMVEQESGRKSLDAKDFSQALIHYKNALKNIEKTGLNIPISNAWKNHLNESLGGIYYKANKPHKALQYFEKSADYSETSQLMLAVVYLDNKWENDVIAIDEKQSDLRNNNTTNSIPKDKYNKIIKVLTTLADKNNTDAASMLARIYLGKEYDKRACNRYLKQNLSLVEKYATIAEKSDIIENYLTLYLLHREKNDSEKTIKYLEKICEKNDNTPYLNDLLYMYMESKQYDKVYPIITDKLMNNDCLAALLFAWFCAHGITKKSNKISIEEKNIKGAIAFLKKAVDYFNKPTVMNLLGWYMKLEKEIDIQITNYFKKNPHEVELKKIHKELQKSKQGPIMLVFNNQHA